MNGKQVLKILKNEGWEVVRVNGSHHVLIKSELTVTVPVHGSKDLKTGTLKNIEKQTGVRLI